MPRTEAASPINFPNLSEPQAQSGEDRDRFNQTAEIINGVITPDLLYANLEALQPPAPSGTVLHTRTPTIARLLDEAGMPPDEFNDRFLGTRSPAVLSKNSRIILFAAHADEPTYLPPAATNEFTFELMPICAHRPTETGLEFPAAVLRYDPATEHYGRVSIGVIGTTDAMKPYYRASFKPQNGFRPGYDRIVYAPTLALNPETGLVTGNMDNAAGIAASAAAVKALVKIAERRDISVTDFGAGWLFPDMEEGLPQDSAYFARGARNMSHRIPPNSLPDVIVNVDGHDTQEPLPTAAYAAYVSRGKGSIVPPDIYATFDDYLQQLIIYGVDAQRTEEIGSVSRSDDAGMMNVHDQIMPVGYWVRDPHHNQGSPTANLNGLVQTAKAIAWIAAEAR